MDTSYMLLACRLYSVKRNRDVNYQWSQWKVREVHIHVIHRWLHGQVVALVGKYCDLHGCQYIRLKWLKVGWGSERWNTCLETRPLPSTAFSSFRINTWREGLGDCLYRFGSRLCNIYVMSHVGRAAPVFTWCQKQVSWYLFGHLWELWTFSIIESAFVKYLGLVNLSNEADLVAQTFKYVTSHAFCNLIGPPRSWHTDPKWYRQSPRPSLSVCLSWKN